METTSTPTPAVTASDKLDAITLRFLEAVKASQAEAAKRKAKSDTKTTN